MSTTPVKSGPDHVAQCHPGDRLFHAGNRPLDADGVGSPGAMLFSGAGSSEGTGPPDPIRASRSSTSHVWVSASRGVYLEVGLRSDPAEIHPGGRPNLSPVWTRSQGPFSTIAFSARRLTTLDQDSPVPLTMGMVGVVRADRGSQ